MSIVQPLTTQNWNDILVTSPKLESVLKDTNLIYLLYNSIEALLRQKEKELRTSSLHGNSNNQIDITSTEIQSSLKFIASYLIQHKNDKFE